MKPKRNRTRDIAFYALLAVILVCTVYTIISGDSGERYSYKDIVQLFKDEKVQNFDYDGTSNVLTLKLKEKNADGEDTVSYEMYSFSLFYNELGELIDQQRADGILEDYDITPVRSSWLLSLLPSS